MFIAGLFVQQSRHRIERHRAQNSSLFNNRELGLKKEESQNVNNHHLRLGKNFFFFRFFPSSRIFPKEHLLQHTHTFLWAQRLQGTAECLQVTFILVKIILSVMDNKGKAVSTQWPYTVRVYKDGMEDQILRTQPWQEHLTEKQCALCSSFCASFLHRLRGLTMWLTRSPY